MLVDVTIDFGHSSSFMSCMSIKNFVRWIFKGVNVLASSHLCLIGRSLVTLLLMRSCLSLFLFVNHSSFPAFRLWLSMSHHSLRFFMTFFASYLSPFFSRSCIDSEGFLESDISKAQFCVSFVSVVTTADIWRFSIPSIAQLNLARYSWKDSSLSETTCINPIAVLLFLLLLGSMPQNSWRVHQTF